MLTAIGIILLIIGGILCSVALTRARGVRLLFAQPLTMNALTKFDQLALKFSGICRAALYFSIEGNQVTTGSADSEYIHHEMLYSFPIKLKFFDHANELILEQDLTADCHKDTARVVEAEDVDENGGAVTLEHRLERFTAPRAAVKRIEAELTSDDKYTNQLHFAELRLYDSMTRHIPSIMLASAFFFLGIVFVFVDIIQAISNL